MPIDPEIQRALNDILAGQSNTCGTFTLAANPATSTTVTRNGVSSTSVIALMPYSSAATPGDITYVTPGNGSFVVHHTASASTRTFRYEFRTPTQ